MWHHEALSGQDIPAQKATVTAVLRDKEEAIFPGTATYGENNGVSTITPERFNQWLEGQETTLRIRNLISRLFVVSIAP